MLHNLFGALTGLALIIAGPIPGESQLANTANQHEAGAKSKHKHGKGHGHGHDCDVEVAGSFTVVHNGPPSVTPVAPDLCIIELDPSFVFIEDMDGSFTSLFVIEHAGACDQAAAEYFSTSGVWEGSVLGAEGSFEYSFEGSIDSQGIASGDLVIIEGSGTGELEGIEGTLHLNGLAGVEGTYSGTLELH